MGNAVFNIAKGRGVELYNRVKSDDPANSAFIWVLGLGAITDATLLDLDTLQAILDDAGFTEAAFTNYARIVVTQAELAALPAPDDSNDRRDVDIPDPQWVNAGGASNETLTRALLCYDADTTGGSDSDIIPVVFWDFAVTTNGQTLTGNVDAAGFLRSA